MAFIFKRVFSDVLSMLMEHGANLNAENIFQNTPIHLASAKIGNRKVVAKLLSHGADVNAKNIFLKHGIKYFYFRCFCSQNITYYFKENLI